MKVCEPLYRHESEIISGKDQFWKYISNGIFWISVGYAVFEGGSFARDVALFV